MKKKMLISAIIAASIVIIVSVFYILYLFNYIPHKKYSNDDFNIKTYKSNIDKGIFVWYDISKQNWRRNNLWKLCY